jgi:hypothetical protein
MVTKDEFMDCKHCRCEQRTIPHLGPSAKGESGNTYKIYFCFDKKCTPSKCKWWLGPMYTPEMQGKMACGRPSLLFLAKALYESEFNQAPKDLALYEPEDVVEFYKDRKRGKDNAQDQ